MELAVANVSCQMPRSRHVLIRESLPSEVQLEMKHRSGDWLRGIAIKWRRKKNWGAKDKSHLSWSGSLGKCLISVRSALFGGKQVCTRWEYHPCSNVWGNVK